MIESGAHLYGFHSFVCVSGVGGVTHAYRNRVSTEVITVVVVAELAKFVPSPGVDVSIAAQGQRMPRSGTDLHVAEIRRQIRVCLAIRCPHHDRRRPSASRPVAKLAIIVVSPRVGVPVAAHGQRMPVSGAYLCGFQSFARVSGIGGVAHAHRNIRIAGAVVAELAIAVVPPGVDVSVAAQGQRMLASGADLHVGEIRRQVRVCLAVGRPHHDLRIPAGGRPSVAELAFAVVSPCVGVPVAANGQGETIGIATVIC